MTISTAPIARRALLGRCLSVLGGLALAPRLARAAPTDRRPVVLVNGYGDSSSLWSRSDNRITASLVGAGYQLDGRSLVPFAYPPSAIVPGLEDTQGDILANGTLLAGAIVSAVAGSPTGQVDVVGFSMGGLVARCAINALALLNPVGAPVVNTAVLIATPSLGVDVLSYLSEVAGRYDDSISQLAREYAGINLDSTSVKEMQPGSDFLNDLNVGRQTDARVRYVLMAGAGQVQLARRMVVPVGDGMVSPRSATHLPGAESRVYSLLETIAGSLTSLSSAIRASKVFHPRLPYVDIVGAAVAAELQSGPSKARAEVDWHVQNGDLAIESRPAI
ncbi:MAG: alpha/beta hydrolase [Chloroflexi bacterium]|nr:alpha/beta hydrolase [Chloroflexota bacterium]